MRGAAILLAVLFSATAARGASFEVAPTTLELSAGKPGLLYITNNGARPVAIQIQPMDWKQTNGADALTPSTTLIVSPPMVDIMPGSRQLVRVLADDMQAQRERQYRLLLDQLPADGAAHAGVEVLLQLNIPVFASSGGRPSMVWRAHAVSDGTEISGLNTGPATVKLSRIAITPPGGTQQYSIEGLTYLLPGTQHRWHLSLREASSLHLVARDERSGAALDADIPVQP
ncbi:MAG: fimbrial biogenesis chaperone [Rhizomicrobium sp.]